MTYSPISFWTQWKIEDEDNIDNSGLSGIAADGSHYVDNDSSSTSGDYFTFNVNVGGGSGNYTFSMPSSVTLEGRTFTIINNNNGTYSLLKSQFQYLNNGQAIELQFNITVTDTVTGQSATGLGQVAIIGKNEPGQVVNQAPVVQWVHYYDDEDGNESVGANDTTIGGRLVFNFVGTDPNGDALTYNIQTGTYTHPGAVGSYTVTATSTPGTFSVAYDGRTYTVKNLGNGTFEYLTSDFQYLNPGQQVFLALKYTATDTGGLTSSFNWAKATITGTADNNAPCVVNVAYSDDEDGLNTITPNGTLQNTKLIFGFNGSDADGNALTYSVKTGTYTIDGQTYTVASTSTAGTFTITNNGQTFVVKNLNNGTFEFLTSEFQYLNSGQTRTLAFQYQANDGSSNSNVANAKVTIHGTSDNLPPVVQWVHYYDDEDGNESFAPNDTEVANNLVFSFVGTDPNGDALTYNIVTGSYTHGEGLGTYTVTATGTPGVFNVNYLSKNYTVTILPNGKFQYNTADFQYLNPGQNVFLALKYTATDTGGLTSGINWAKATIYGTADNTTPLVQNVCYSDDEDGLNTVNPSDTLQNTKLIFGFNGSDADGNALTYSIRTGTYTVEGQTYTVTATSTPGTFTITNNGQTFTVKNLNNGTFEFLTSEFQYLNSGQTRTLSFQYQANDGTVSSAFGNAKVIIYGTSDNLPPVVQWVHYYDDEDGDETFSPNDTEVANDLVFSFVGSDPNGDALTYNIVTGTYTHPGGLAPYTVTATSNPNVFNVSYNGKNYVVTNLGNGKFQYQTSDFQYLNPGQEVFIALKYTATDTGGLTSGVNWAKVTIYGRADTSLVASNQQFVDDEDAIDATGATAGGFTDEDDGLPGTLQFTINNYTYVGTGTLTFSGIPSSAVGSDGNTYAITNNGNGTFTVNKAQFQHLAVGEFVTLTFNYTVSDGTLTATAQAQVVIIGTNDGIDAIDDNAGTIADGASVTLNILTNDIDPENEDLDVSSINSLVINGVTIPQAQWSQYFTVNNETGQLVFNSANMNVPAGTSQNVVINYTAVDPHGSTDSANVFINVCGPNVELIAGNELLVDDEDAIDNTGATSGAFTDLDDGIPGTLRFTIDNVTYNGSAPLTYSVPATVVGSNGVTYTLTNLGNGQFSVPTSAFQGLDTGERVELTFNYAVSNGSLTATAQAKVVIIGTNDAPCVVNLTRSDDEDGNESFAPNDTVVANNLVFNFTGATDVDGETLTYVIRTGTFTNGGQTYTVAATGTAGTYTLTNAGQTFTLKAVGPNQFELLTSEFQYLNAGQIRTLKFQFQASDGTTLSNIGVATVNIHGINDTSLVASNQTFIDDEDAVDASGASAVVNGSTVTDQDSGIPGVLQFSITNFTYNGSNPITFSGIPATLVGSDGNTYNVVNNGNGTFTLNKADFQPLAPGEAVTFTFNYTVSDGTLTSSATANVIILGRNDGIDAIDDNAGTIADGASVTLNILTNDIDPENEDLDVSSINSLVINGVTIPQAQWSQYFTVNNETGQLVFNSANMNVPAGTSQNVVINYTAVDPHGSTDSANVFITVTGDPLSLIASNQQWNEDEDATNNTGATGVAAGTTYTDLDQNNGTANNDPLQFTINNFTYNGSGAVTVTGVPATVVGSDGNTYNLTNNGNGTFTLNKAQFQALGVGEAVTLTFNYTVSAGGLTSTAQAQVAIIGTNDGIDAVDDLVGTVNVGDVATYNILNNDTDTDGDDLDVLSINSITINGITYTDPAVIFTNLTVNNETGQISYNTSNMNVPAGTTLPVIINYTATDPYGATDSANIFINIKGPDLSLIASNQQWNEDEDATNNTGATGVAAGTTYTDLDQNNGTANNGPLQFTINNFTYNGSGAVTVTGVPATVVGSDGNTYNLTNNGNGTFTLNKAQFQALGVGEAVTLTFNYTVSAGGLTSTAQAKVVIIGTNDGIDAIDDNAGTIADGASVTLNILTNDIDPENEDLDVSSINSLVINGVTIPQAQWSQYFTVNNETGQLVFNSANMNVPAGTSQNVVINYTAVDPHGSTDSANVFITVQGDELSLIASNQQFVDDEDAQDNSGAVAAPYTDEDDGNAAGSLQFTINNFTYNGSSPVTVSGVPATVVGSDGRTYNLTNNGNGTFSVPTSEFQHIPVGQFVTLAFTYTVTAGALTDTAQAQVVIIGRNDGPDAVDDNVGTITEGTVVTYPNVMVNDSDPDGDVITVTSVNSITIDGVVITNPAQIAEYVTILPNGQLTLDTSSIEKDNDYTIVVNYTITDPYGLSDSANVIFNVDNVNKVIYYGDMENCITSLTTNPANAQDTIVNTSGTISNIVKNMNDNTVVLDDADAYGDVKNFTLSVTSGNATAFASPAVEGGTEYALAVTDAAIQNNTFNFGDDTVTVNRGLIVGDAANFSMIGDQGDSSANFDPNCFDPFAKATANVDIRNNTFNFGNDTLTMGKGDVYADVQTLTFSYANGTASGNGITMDDDNWNTGNTFNFGDDILSAREGLLVGDLGSAVVNGVTYNMAGQLAAFQATTAYTANTFNFGNDIFQVNVSQNVDVTIADFGIGGVADKFKVTGLSDINGGGLSISDLTAVSVVVNDGGRITLLIDADNNGSNESSVTFANINFVAGQVEITDYITNTDIIISA